MENDRLHSKKEVLTYLAGQGFKIKKSALYQHIKEGRLRPGADGAFEAKDVDKYAKLFLRRLDGEQAAGRAIEALQARRLRAETAKLESQARHWEIKAKLAAGEVVKRYDVEMRLVSQAVALKASWMNFIRTETPKMIRLCGGDLKVAGEVIYFMEEAAATWLDEFAKWDYEVKYEPDPDDQDHIKATVTKLGRHESTDDDDDDEAEVNDKMENEAWE